jgi:protein-S-isoprenylcysteine O-methyltransferase Ste14
MSTLALKIPPLVLLALVGLASWLVCRLLPRLSFELPLRFTCVAGLVALGAAFSLGGVVTFFRAQTTIDPRYPDNAARLVVSGVYRISRNPMYVGDLLFLAAWAALLSNLAAFAALPLFVAYMNRYQIAPEERALHAKFGSAFTEYERAVRRWL